MGLETACAKVVIVNSDPTPWTYSKYTLVISYAWPWCTYTNRFYNLNRFKLLNYETVWALHLLVLIMHTDHFPSFKERTKVLCKKCSTIWDMKMRQKQLTCYHIMTHENLWNRIKKQWTSCSPLCQTYKTITVTNCKWRTFFNQLRLS